jgi:alpha,alpha-trehalase
MNSTRRKAFIHALRAVVLLSVVELATAQTQVEVPQQFPDPPQVIFAALFSDVEMQHLFIDSKAFADAVPLEPPVDILDAYHALRPQSATSLRRFVDAHFLPPHEVAAPSDTPSHHLQIAQHIDQLWEPLTRQREAVASYSSLLVLPRPYVVPGGRFRELYYWDSYFTMLGLLRSGRRDLVVDMVQDFAFLIDSYGHIPNGTRSYYLSRSQPPLFYKMVALLSSQNPDVAFGQFLPQLRREYDYWMQGATHLRRGSAARHVVALPDGSLLNRYWDERETPRDESFREDTELALTANRPAQTLWRDIRATAESGWDFSSRWLDDGRSVATVITTEIVPIDLNSLMFGLETAISFGCKAQAQPDCAREFTRRARARQAAVERYLWDGSTGAYLDYRWTRRNRIQRLSAATLYPLFTGLASTTHAAKVASTVKARLLKAGGIVTTTQETGQQWDAPNGWAPIQWIAIAGLRSYNKPSLAETIACRWMFNVNTVYARTGKLVEKYDVVHLDRASGGGEYPLQDGFGWTNGVMRELMALYQADGTSRAGTSCLNTQ